MGSPHQPPGEGRPQDKQVFAAARMVSDAIAAAAFGLLGAGLFALTVMSGVGSRRAGWIWGLGLPALVVLGGIGFMLLLRYFDRGAVLKLSATGLKARGLHRPLRWDEIEDVELDERRRGLRMLVHVKPVPGDKRNRTLQAIPLQRLKAPQRQAAFEAVLARLGASRAAQGLGETRSTRDLREAAQFEQKLRELTPSVWSATAVVGVNVAVWLVQVAMGVPPLQPSPEVLLQWGGNSAAAVVLDGQVWRLLTATMLHGGLMHLALNMFGLWEPGRQLARQIGNGQFLLVYLASALCGSAASLHFSAQASVSIGASGAVFGVLGALVASSWKHRSELPALSSKRLWSGPGLFLVYALVQGFGSARVDNAAHVGGLLAGLLLGLLLVVRFDAERPQDRIPQATLGALLAAAAVLVGVLTAPLPRTWHGPLLAAQHVLRQAGPEFDSLGRGLQRFKGRDASDPEMRTFLEKEFIPRCASIQRDLLEVRVPRWEPAGRAAVMMGRMCSLLSEAARIDLAATTPEQRAEVHARIAPIQKQVRVLAEGMAALREATLARSKP